MEEDDVTAYTCYENTQKQILREKAKSEKTKCNNCGWKEKCNECVLNAKEFLQEFFPQEEENEEDKKAALLKNAFFKDLESKDQKNITSNNDFTKEAYDIVKDGLTSAKKVIALKVLLRKMRDEIHKVKNEKRMKEEEEKKKSSRTKRIQ